MCHAAGASDVRVYNVCLKIRNVMLIINLFCFDLKQKRGYQKLTVCQLGSDLLKQNPVFVPLKLIYF